MQEYPSFHQLFQLGSGAGPVIQANGRLNFEDDLRSGSLLYCVSQWTRVCNEYVYYGNTSCGLTQFSKSNNFLWVCWFLGKNISNFVPPAWKLYNPYCHNIYSGEDRIWYIRQFKVYQVVGWFTCETPGHYRQTNVLCWWDEKAGSEIRNSSKGFWHSFLEQSLPKFNLTTSVTND